jgi:hypothetical protein
MYRRPRRTHSTNTAHRTDSGACL